jgi:hypothetical protein
MSSLNSPAPLRRISLATTDTPRDDDAPQWHDAPAIAGEDRRAFPRLTPSVLQWLRETRLKYGPGVRLIDVSAGGALIETQMPLRPDAGLVLELIGYRSVTVAESQVIRCHVAGVRSDRVLYRGACVFARRLEMPELLVPPPRVNPGDFIRPDVALKTIVEGFIQQPAPAPGGTIATPEAAIFIDALVLLQAAAAKRSDSADRRLANLLDQVVPSMKRCEPASVVVAQIVDHLRRAMPLLAIRVVEAPPSTAAAASESMYFALLADSVLPPKVMTVEFPAGFTLDAAQFRLVKASAYLMSALRRWRPQPVQPVVEPADAPPPPMAQPAPQATSQPSDVEKPPPSGWHRMVVRFCDGKLLKGYCSDFSPSRGLLNLRPTVAAPPAECLVVPLADLKALFFVRDFDGNAGRLDDRTSAVPPRGRKIEVTFRDGEVLVGFTLTYQPGGQGFFVLPENPEGNNIRVYVVSAAVRHARFI